MKAAGIFQLLDTCYYCASENLIDRSFPLLLLEDIFEMQTGSEYHDSFEYLEAHYEKIMALDVKNRVTMLRLCNNVLRHLTKHLDMGIAGRVMLLLANSLPLADRSGLNAAGKYNILPFSKIENDEIVSDLFNIVWGLPVYFRSPMAVLSDNKFQDFFNSIQATLNAFRDNPIAVSSSMQLKYFPKYLPSPRLLSMQLRDPEFRLSLLIHTLICTQFWIQSISKKVQMAAKVPKTTLDALKALMDQIYGCIDALPFGNIVPALQSTFERELTWTSWKDDKGWLGRVSETKEGEPNLPRKRLSEDYAIARPKRIKMGNAELGRLWDAQEETEYKQPTIASFLFRVAEEEDPGLIFCSFINYFRSRCRRRLQRVETRKVHISCDACNA